MLSPENRVMLSPENRVYAIPREPGIFSAILSLTYSVFLRIAGITSYTKQTCILGSDTTTEDGGNDPGSEKKETSYDRIATTGTERGLQMTLHLVLVAGDFILVTEEEERWALQIAYEGAV